MEAKATGNNALAGGLAALTAESAAPLVMQQLYGTDNPANLTEKQKQNVANLSQIAAGLAGGLVGDSTASGIAGAEIGKRAVENNYLSQLSQNRKEWLQKQLERGDITSVQREKYEKEFIQLEKDDHTSDFLVKKAKDSPEKMTKSDWELYSNYANRYYLESVSLSEKSSAIENNLNNILSDNHIKGYSYPYAVNEKYSSELPSRWSIFGLDKSQDEKFYSNINSKYKNREAYENSFNGRVAKSTADALSYASLVSPTGSLLAGIPKIGELASKYPTLSEMAIIGAVNTGSQLSGKDPYTYSSLIESELSYLLTRRDSAGVAWSKNMMLGSFMEQAEKQEKEMRYGIKEDPEYFKKSLSITLGVGGSKVLDVIFSKSNNPYVTNIIKPAANSAIGESIPKTINEVNEVINQNMKNKEK